jgi:hypothetical protein
MGGLGGSLVVLGLQVALGGQGQGCPRGVSGVLGGSVGFEALLVDTRSQGWPRLGCGWPHGGWSRGFASGLGDYRWSQLVMGSLRVASAGCRWTQGVKGGLKGDRWSREVMDVFRRSQVAMEDCG